MTNSPFVIEIIERLNHLYKTLPPSRKDLGMDYLVKAKAELHAGNYEKAYHTVCSYYKICGQKPNQVDSLFASIRFAEDVVTADTTLVIHQDSPYYKSIANLAQKLGFNVKKHNLPYGMWTKDYIVSTGKQVMIPVVAEPNPDYLNPPQVLIQAKQNTGLYYGPLAMKEHHKSKQNVTSQAQWEQNSEHLFTHTKTMNKTILEGGNFFCAINNQGQRYYLVGENVVSETMAFRNWTRKQVIAQIAKELDCPPKFLLFIPQWTYHLDLQMGYLGNGQFIIHSFDQKSFDFDLDKDTTDKLQKTFSLLKEKFETTIIDKLCSILSEHDFAVQKIFGCLFYLEDSTDEEQMQYVPYCKSSDGFDGVLALMMNGVALNLGQKGRHFIMPRCDMPTFRSQFEKSLQSLGIEAIHDADMLDAYVTGDFEGMAIGVWGATNVAQVAAFMNGSIRCQTSIVNNWHLTPPVTPHVDVEVTRASTPSPRSLRFFSPSPHQSPQITELTDKDEQTLDPVDPNKIKL